MDITKEMVMDEIENRHPWLYKYGVESCELIGRDRARIVFGNGREFIYDERHKGNKLQEVKRFQDLDSMDEDEWRLAFSYALEREMERANMSVNQLAKLLNKSPGTVTRYLKGTSEPTGFIIYRMSEIFNCNFSDLEYMDFYL